MHIELVKVILYLSTCCTKFHSRVAILHLKNIWVSVSIWLLHNPHWLFINYILLSRFSLVVILLKLNLHKECVIFDTSSFFKYYWRNPVFSHYYYPYIVVIGMYFYCIWTNFSYNPFSTIFSIHFWYACYQFIMKILYFDMFLVIPLSSALEFPFPINIIPITHFSQCCSFQYGITMWYFLASTICEIILIPYILFNIMLNPRLILIIFTYYFKIPPLHWFTFFKILIDLSIILIFFILTLSFANL